MLVPWRVSKFMNWEQWSSWSSIDDSWPSSFVHYSRLFSEVFVSKLAICETENHNGNEIENHVWNFHCMLFILLFVCVRDRKKSHVQKDSRRTLSQAHVFEWPKFTVGLGDGSMVNFMWSIDLIPYNPWDWYICLHFCLFLMVKIWFSCS